MPVFECNICLDSVQDPVVTLCGHLFCRPCLDKWLQFHSHRHECPVCKARVDDDKLVPIYGNGSSSSDLLLDIPSQQPQTAPVSPELPPELTYVRQDRSHAPQGLTCNCLFGAISSVWSILVVAVSSIWNLLFSAISSVCSILSGAISSIWNILDVVMSSIWNLLFSAISSVCSILSGAISSICNILVVVVSSIWNLLFSVISSIWNILVIGITCVWNTLADTECLWIPPQAQRNPLAFLTICFIGFLLLYVRVSSWLS